MKNGKKYVFSLIILLSVLWLLLSGHYNYLLLSLGLCSMALVLFFSWRMRLIDGEGQPLLHLDLPALINYWCWLLKEIFVSGIDVCRLILMPDMRLNPRIISFSNDQPSDLTRSILANSITLTPGTVTIDIEDDTTNVHALTDQSADGLLKGAMISRVAALAKIPDKAGE